ncbi:MAG: dihydrofolate reductase [Phycisphaeraceae bacterium]
MPELTLIAAVADNGVIGRGGDLPWRLPDDLKRFKRLTMGKPVILGRKTYQSIGRPLPGRTMIVLSRSADAGAYPAEVRLAGTLDEAMRRVDEADDAAGAMVIGGAAVYELAMPRAERMHLTHVHAEVEGDVFFPGFDASAWRVESEEHHPADERHGYAFTFRDYVRVG